MFTCDCCFLFSYKQLRLPALFPNPNPKAHALFAPCSLLFSSGLLLLLFPLPLAASAFLALCNHSFSVSRPHIKMEDAEIQQRHLPVASNADVVQEKQNHNHPDENGQVPSAVLTLSTDVHMTDDDALADTKTTTHNNTNDAGDDKVSENNGNGEAGSDKVPNNNNDGDATHVQNQLQFPTSITQKKYSSSRTKHESVTKPKSVWTDSEMGEADESGTPEERAAFMKELETFYRENALEFKPPKFYGEPLNCLKLSRAVINLGGYDVALLEFERYKRQNDELQLPVLPPQQAASVEKEASAYQASGSGRARRESATCAMQGWHAQRLLGYGEVSEPVIKDKNLNSAPRREKALKSIGSGVQKQKTINMELAEPDKELDAEIVDIGPPADWVKINIQKTKDFYEVFALVPGLLREEVRVQSDPAGPVVITGQPEQLDNPWGITPFKKVVSLPARIDPLQTSAVVSLHGRLHVRVPFEEG